MSVKELRIAEINSQIDKAIEDRNDNVSIPLETIKNFMISCCYRDKDKPFGKPYIGKGGEIFTFTSERSAFGFDSDGYWRSVDDTHSESKNLAFFTNYWQPFPQEKWDAMLLDYAKSRGYEKGNHDCLYYKSRTFVGNIVDIFINEGDVWIRYSGLFNAKIFDSKTGVWAQIIEPKVKKNDLTDIENDLTIHFYFGIDFANVTDEPKVVVFDRLTLNFDTIDPNRYTADEWIEIMKLGFERKKSGE